MQVEDEDEPDPIHFEFMQDSMIGIIAGTLRTVPIIDPIATRVEAAEAVNRIGEADEDLAEAIIIITAAEVTTNNTITTIIMARHSHSEKAIMLTVEHQLPPALWVLPLYPLTLITNIQPEGLRHKTMQGTCISSNSSHQSTAVLGALGILILRCRVDGDIEPRRRLRKLVIGQIMR